jgi:hypothetical protein
MSLTSKEAAMVLRLHNAWRRGDESVPNMTDPKLLGEAIDSAILLIEQRDELLAAIEYHQAQTRPIQSTIDVIARVKGESLPSKPAENDLAGIERECCGTFFRTPHRSTCKNYRGKKGGVA